MVLMVYKASGYCDLNINSKARNLKDLVLRAATSGYQTIAINTTVFENDEHDNIVMKKGKKKQKQSNSDTVPAIPELTRLSFTSTDLLKHKLNKPPILLSRITLVYGNTDSPLLKQVAVDAVQKYDLVAVTPTSQAAFKQVCQTLPFVDIISMDPCGSNLNLSKNLLWDAVQRNIYFEIKYNVCIGSGNPKQLQGTFQLGNELSRIIDCGNMIVCSGANSVETLRAPRDVANLMHSVFPSSTSSIRAIAVTCHDAIKFARERKPCFKKCAVSALTENIKNEEDYNVLQGKRKLDHCESKKSGLSSRVPKLKKRKMHLGK
uniref:Ribonuclease P protein subunit drpp30-like n=1 Tax=Hirondellea gigas TaxID=1518452 RepID=A0A2P2I6M0_9CRUS